MPAFILINELTHCARRVTEDEIRVMVDARTNPAGGYTDLERCMEMILHPEGGAYMAFPVSDRHGTRYTIHIDGRLDYPHKLRYQPADHRCGPLCLLPDKEKQIIQVVSR
jgi:hypothetical protein